MTSIQDHFGRAKQVLPGGGPRHHGFSIQHTGEDIDRVLSVPGEVLLMKSDKC